MDVRLAHHSFNPTSNDIPASVFLFHDLEHNPPFIETPSLVGRVGLMPPLGVQPDKTWFSSRSRLIVVHFLCTTINPTSCV